MSSTIYPVILSGGSGTRLWPLSRDLSPKQFLPLVEETSLLAATAGRVSGDQFAAPIVVCNQDHDFIVAGQLSAIGIKPEAIILEPIARNTAAAIAAAAAIVRVRDPQGLMLVLPSDHVVQNQEAFVETVAVAAAAARAGHLVTFGIKPTAPETGYGYIRSGTALDGIPGAFRIARFVEKPDLATANTYLTERGWSWNSGMFVFPAGLLLEDLARFETALVRAAVMSVDLAQTDGTFIHLDADAFAAAPSKSIDYALMERTERAAVVPADLGWSDIGSWSALWELGRKDSAGNVAVGDVIVEGTRTSYIRSDGPLVATLGIKDIVVVATGDVVMVAAKDRAQDVKSLVTHVRKGNRTEAVSHRTIQRPWGSTRTIDSGPGFQVRRLTLNAGAALPPQGPAGPAGPAKHWTVASGTAHVTRGDAVLKLDAPMSVDIPPGMAHGLENRGRAPLELIEVRSGQGCDDQGGID